MTFAPYWASIGSAQTVPEKGSSCPQLLRTGCCTNWAKAVKYTTAAAKEKAISTACLP